MFLFRYVDASGQAHVTEDQSVENAEYGYYFGRIHTEGDHQFDLGIKKAAEFEETVVSGHYGGKKITKVEILEIERVALRSRETILQFDSPLGQPGLRLSTGVVIAPLDINVGDEVVGLGIVDEIIFNPPTTPATPNKVFKVTYNDGVEQIVEATAPVVGDNIIAVEEGNFIVEITVGGKKERYNRRAPIRGTKTRASELRIGTLIVGEPVTAIKIKKMTAVCVIGEGGVTRTVDPETMIGDVAAKNIIPGMTVEGIGVVERVEYDGRRQTEEQRVVASERGAKRTEEIRRIQKHFGFSGRDAYQLAHSKWVELRRKGKLEAFFETIEPDDPDGCPVCGQPMKLRNGINGSFYGCSKFPSCKGTRQAKEPEVSLEHLQTSQAYVTLATEFVIAVGGIEQARKWIQIVESTMRAASSS